MKNLYQRAITGAIFVSLIIISILIDQRLFSLVFLIVAAMGLWEFYSLVETDNITPSKLIGTAVGIFVYVSNALIALNFATYKILLVNIPLISMVFLFELYNTKSLKPFTNISYTIFGVLYISLPFALLNYIANPLLIKDGYHPKLLLGFFFLIWINDTAAYIFGSKFGKRRLFERVSPKKSWEGFFGGAIITLILAFILAKLFNELQVSDWMIISTIIVVFGTYGDLTESLFKRSINCKDSGNILPGHGGILDRFDGVLLSAPMVFAYLEFIY